MDEQRTESMLGKEQMIVSNTMCLCAHQQYMGLSNSVYLVVHGNDRDQMLMCKSYKV